MSQAPASSPSSKKAQPLQRPKGTQDVLPGEMGKWHHIEATARRLFGQYGYSEIRTPVFEYTSLYERGVGEETDIVNKEMYTFEKGERLLTLRPEGTAGVVRGFVENGMSRMPKPVKLYYMGPMFRYERPQAGRQRQFHQIGVEIFGIEGPMADVETILTAMRFFEALGVPNLALEINNIGDPSCRERFREGFRKLMKPHLDSLCENCRRRYDTNPMRMLDCKVPTDKALYQQPEVQQFLAEDFTSDECKAHFQAVQDALTGLGIPFTRNPNLVRGLDYYNRTVFEITSNHLGAQNAVCGGGRYDILFEKLGAATMPGIGWALGVERLVSLIEDQSIQPLDYYIVSDQPAAAFGLQQELHGKGVSAEVDLTGKGFGKQLAAAGKRQARFAVILGESEIQENQVTVKNLENGEQESHSREVFLAQISGGR
ncbi:MAG: histidine--tRNA ligase [Vampirovibrio sp.]|nr:histidine--tRNA ligase [Vampirovibrio sp.]